MNDETAEELAFLKGRIDALIELCSMLIVNHPKSTTIAAIFKNRVETKSSLPPGSACVQAYVSGYESVTPDVEAIAKSFRRDQLDVLPTPKAGDQ